MADKNDFSEIIAEILIELQAQRRELQEQRREHHEDMEQLRKEHRENTERMISAFNTGFTAVVDRLIQIDTRLEKVVDHEARISRLENIVLKAS